MQTWEYLYVWANVDGEDYRPQEVNGQELPNWERGPSISEYMNQVGAEGWEMVGYSAAGYPMTGVSLHQVFKRPQTQVTAAGD